MSEKHTLYDLVLKQADAMINPGIPFISAMSNCAALLFNSLPDINWAGFYIRDQDSLMLGPFCGQPACLQIEIGKGVCGTALAKDTSIVVENVHMFPGHIACDNASNAEIVIPIHHNERVVAVLDLDSPLLARFDDYDRQRLEELVLIFEKRVNWVSFSL